MRQVLGEFWNDECGSLQDTEWVFVVTILVMAIVPAVTSVRTRLHQAGLPSADSAPLICGYQADLCSRSGDAEP